MLTATFAFDRLNKRTFSFWPVISFLTPQLKVLRVSPLAFGAHSKHKTELRL